MKRKTIDIITLGCSKNLVDSEHLMRQLEEAGYHVTHDTEKPEGEIAKLEERNTVIDEELTKEEIYSNSIECQKLSTERAENEEKLEVLYERWEELAEEV